MIVYRHEPYTHNQPPTFAFRRDLDPSSLDDYTTLQQDVAAALPGEIGKHFVPRNIKGAGLTALEGSRIRRIQQEVPALTQFPIAQVADYVFKQLPESIERPLDVTLPEFHSMRTRNGIQIVAEVSDPDDTALKEREAAARGLERLIERPVLRKDMPPLISIGLLALTKHNVTRNDAIRNADVLGALEGVHRPDSLTLQPLGGVIYDLPPQH
jgi:hypothetical protein